MPNRGPRTTCPGYCGSGEAAFKHDSYLRGPVPLRLISDVAVEGFTAELPAWQRGFRTLLSHPNNYSEEHDPPAPASGIPVRPGHDQSRYGSNSFSPAITTMSGRSVCSTFTVEPCAARTSGSLR
jgi:hypothetical protein